MRKQFYFIVFIFVMSLCVVSFLITFSCSGDDDDNNDSTQPTTTPTEMQPTTTPTTSNHPLVGIWSGTWTDTVFNVSGSLDATITQSGDELSGTGLIGLGPFGLGQVQGTASGTISGNTVNFTFSASVGSGSGTIVDNAISGSGSVGDPLPFSLTFSFDGAIDGDTVNGTFAFDGGGAGVATVMRQ